MRLLAPSWYRHWVLVCQAVPTGILAGIAHVMPLCCLRVLQSYHDFGQSCELSIAFSPAKGSCSSSDMFLTGNVGIYYIGIVFGDYA